METHRAEERERERGGGGQGICQAHERDARFIYFCSPLRYGRGY